MRNQNPRAPSLLLMNSIRELDWIISPAATFSFLAGAASVSLIWYFQERQRKRQQERRRQRIRQRQRQRQQQRNLLRQQRQRQQLQQQNSDDAEEEDDDISGYNYEFEFYDEQKLILRKEVDDEEEVVMGDYSDDENDDIEDDDTIQASISSWMDPLCQSVQDIKSSMEDITCRIGELPASFFRRRITLKRWPWDQIPRSPSASTSDTARTLDELSEASSFSYSTDEREADTTGGTAAAVAAAVVAAEDDLQPEQQQQQQQQKSGCCIGSIFGLDVGGTLAKLVYFEQKPNDVVEVVHNREYNYQMSASAQAVVKARRGHPHGRSAPIRSSSFTEHTTTSDAAPTTPPRMNRRITTGASIDLKVRHSRQSHDDLKLLYSVRQESLPDDLGFYARAIHLPRSEFTSVESMKRAVLGAPDAVNESKNDLGASGNSNDSTRNSMRKSRSMFDLSKSRDHAQALDRFYNFAKRLDSHHGAIKDNKLSFYSRELGGEFHFIRFETRKMWNAMELIRSNNLHLNICEMGATGGGAHKYANDWDRILGIKIKKEEELDSLVAGMQFVLSTVVGECYTYRPKRSTTTAATSNALNQSDDSRKHIHDDQNSSDRMDTPDGSNGNGSRPGNEKIDRNPPSPHLSTSFSSDASDSSNEEKKTGLPLDSDSDAEETGDESCDEWWWSRKVQRDAISYSSTYPYLLVTIGTGVSVLRVDGPRKHERISGSTIGGGTYWGLIRLLTDVEDFEDVMRLAERGDPRKVDMMVGDIYGNNSDALEKLGLPSNIVASSFGKLVSKENPAAGLKQEDLARALLFMVTTNIGQVAYLNAKLHNTPRIYFVGNFLRNNKFSQRRLSFAIDYWSKGTMEALFLEHEGYFGSLGAFLLSQNIKTKSFEQPSKSSSKLKSADKKKGKNKDHDNVTSTRSKPAAQQQKRQRSSSISSKEEANMYINSSRPLLHRRSQTLGVVPS